MRTSTRTLRIPCADPDHASRFAEHLRAEEIDVDGVEGRDVLIPTGGDPGFVFWVAEQSAEFAHDDEAASAVREFIGGAL